MIYSTKHHSYLRASSVGDALEIIIRWRKQSVHAPRSPERMAQAIEKLLKNPILPEMLRKAATKRKKLFLEHDS